VRDLITDPDDAGIVSAVISMGKSLHMGVVAEGVETRKQLSFLQTHCCPDGQGYYFSEALVPEQFRQLMRRNASEVDPWALRGGFGEKSQMSSHGV
jgi:EAL domain-containing protein (putative c-di-GMP-specific phosphodiesterase class I)